ncbi:3-hydroxyacyl-CoA dehydrogenase NAD-binding domain-containing protein [Cellulomonas fimi]|uniref:3-hydroxyacyl-CoA dehydrogenase NAD-binding protein n=1 Tax=Cellulomonas fimi (strain ATCC 484 / DSM 20113 / JCM 1341 / CCUG 24087 / LMG 16345 / NBRC 15513 / NCIMB 8980 / NCTC 7547 / NRS-133) TaxID=590998 RepID=F4H1F6_CELFA|nr:3-hydroxyacyl-CoA dehydrogenase NAD-binding domain-containing protein [Cellulomonas fimi]AEE46255.1 3-hydroxyacyl-CoA dehydrogenase NAD-binding protein [Cellulomonas fimi ATCC 484]NNH06194.1 3-hydroxyacyl-CoA dehydrogenase [Cellulomonas fimi]VEH32254.1 Fatty acid oxidation complex subunit alpha [Cellulomonas fimi]
MSTSDTPQPRPERVTHAHVRDVALPGRAGTLALVTVDNGLDHTKPTTFGPLGIAELTAALSTVRERVRAGEVQAVAVTGKPYFLAAGADLTQVTTVADRDTALGLGRGGHAAYVLLHDMGVPTFAFVNGVALGGGLELALNCDYRTVASDVRALALPETGLGLVPGWGGAYVVPRLVGVEKALDVILTRPAANKPYAAAEAAAIGLVDVVLDPADFLEESIRWAARVVSGDLVVERRPLDPQPVWEGVVAAARQRLDAVVHGSRPAPYRALDLVAAARTATRDEAFAAEDEALADLIMSDEMRASVYAFGLVSGGKKPVGAPDASLAQPVTRVGIVGAGLMAAQIALLFAQRLGVPVVMRDLDDERVGKGLAAVRSTVERLVSTGRMSEPAGARLLGSVTGTTDLGDLASCDLVIEAVTEILDLKKRVFAELEGVVSPTTVLATNTSALSVTAMAADLQHPERVVGLHFFNPVAAMPLVEVVQAQRTSAEPLATGFAVAAKLRKTAVLVADRPGFVVNRLLVLLLGVIVDAVEHGTPVEVADRALRPLGLPMPPFELFDLVGPAVGLHVLTSLREDLGDRFPHSPGLEKLVADGTRVVLDAPAKGLPKPVDPAIQAVFDAAREVEVAAQPLDDAGVLDAVLTALTVEVGHMLDEGVVTTPQQIDLCMILGAGWGFHLGGLTPYLDRTGYSERVLGRRLLPDGVANVPTR